jgi:hypothetical protein
MGNSYADQVRTCNARGWHVYVIAEKGDAFCKIGSAVTVAYLLQQLQNGNPRRLRLIADWHVSSRDAARAVESHALTSAGLLRLERRNWLECHPDAAVSFVRCAMARLGVAERVAQ